jgi:hypothetical protein
MNFRFTQRRGSNFSKRSGIKKIVAKASVWNLLKKFTIHQSIDPVSTGLVQIVRGYEAMPHFTVSIRFDLPDSRRRNIDHCRNAVESGAGLLDRTAEIKLPRQIPAPRS